MTDQDNQNEKKPGENPDGTFHFNPGNMAGKTPSDPERTSENRNAKEEADHKPVD